MAKKRKGKVPVLTITELFMLKMYAEYMLSYSNVQDNFDLPNNIWLQLPVLIDKLENLMRLGEPVTYEDLIYVRGKKRNKQVYDERNILIYAMNLYRNNEEPDEYEAFVMRDLEEKIGNPMYFKDSRRMAPIWFMDMELNRTDKSRQTDLTDLIEINQI